MHAESKSSCHPAGPPGLFTSEGLTPDVRRWTRTSPSFGLGQGSLSHFQDLTRSTLPVYRTPPSRSRIPLCCSSIDSQGCR